MKYSPCILCRRTVAAVALTMGLCAAAPALTLTEAVEGALARHPERHLEAARRGVADAIARKAGQFLAADPSITLKHETDAVGSANGYRQWEGGVELPLWWPGQPESRRQEAARTLDEADAMDKAHHLEVAGEVRERVWQLAMARSERDLARADLELARQLYRDVERRVDAGELPRSDRVLAQRELLTREQAQAQAEARVEETGLLFTRLTGLAPQIEPQSEPEPQSRELAPAHPALALAEAEAARVRAERDRVKADRRSGPSLWLGAKQERGLSGEDYDASVAVQISLPLGLESQSAPEVARAESDLTAALAARERRRLELEDALISAQLEWKRSAEARERSLRQQQLAEESLKLSHRAFELGETDLVRLLQAQESAISARHDAQIRAVEYARAVSRLNQALGVAPQ